MARKSLLLDLPTELQHKIYSYVLAPPPDRPFRWNVPYRIYRISFLQVCSALRRSVIKYLQHFHFLYSSHHGPHLPGWFATLANGVPDSTVWALETYSSLGGEINIDHPRCRCLLLLHRDACNFQDAQNFAFDLKFESLTQMNRENLRIEYKHMQQTVAMLRLVEDIGTVVICIKGSLPPRELYKVLRKYQERRGVASHKATEWSRKVLNEERQVILSLLEPFRRLRGVRKVKIVGNIENHHSDFLLGLASDMMSTEPP